MWKSWPFEVSIINLAVPAVVDYTLADAYDKGL